MTTLAIDDLKRIMRTCAGEDDALDLDGDILETRFADLGYDSLALLETAAHIKREYGVEIDDDDLADLQTPRALLEIVNAELEMVG